MTTPKDLTGGSDAADCSPADWELRCPQCKSYRVKQVELTRAKCLECKRGAHVSMFRVKYQKEPKE
jgi:hypothetical protein